MAAGVISNSVSVNTNGLDAILSASPIVQMTLFILVSLSIVCWAVGFTKFRQFGFLKAQNTAFLSRFWRAKNLQAAYEELDQFRSSSLARVFKAGYEEFRDENTGGLANVEMNVERALTKAIDAEIVALEARLTLLATTGSTGPFIGLFGTVWGIMGSFHKIGQTGSASLAVVAPGISEALIATAVGLIAAIPAVILYNNFTAQVRRSETELNNFAGDFLNLIQKSKNNSASSGN